MATRLHERQRLETLAHACDVLRGRWEEYCARESIFYALFAWLPPVARKRLRVGCLFLKGAWPDGLAQEPWTKFEQIEPALDELRSRLREALDRQRHLVRKAAALLDDQRQCEQRWGSAIEPLLTSQTSAPLDLSQADTLADKLIRFQIFLLTTHYWEGRWLLDMGPLLKQLEEEKRKIGASARTKRWRRWLVRWRCSFRRAPARRSISSRESDRIRVLPPAPRTSAPSLSSWIGVPCWVPAS